MSEYTISPLSNYEGFKRLDKLQEKIANGQLRPPREAVVEHWCDVCHCKKKSSRLVKSQSIGRPISQLGVEVKVRFQGLFVLACEECAGMMERAGIR